MLVAIFTPTPYINKWQMSLCNNPSDNKSYWIHRVDVKVSAQVTTVTYMHQSQPSLHLLCINLTMHLELWPGNHLIWCNATIKCTLSWRGTNAYILASVISLSKEGILFYLTTHSTHFIYGYVATDLVKDQMSSLHGLLFMISSKESFISTKPQTG